MKQFAVLQLTGCSGCEMALLNADEWIDEFDLGYMNLVMSVYDIPEVDVLLVSGGVQTNEDLFKLRRAVTQAKQIVAVGTCAISGGVVNLGARPEVWDEFLLHAERRHLPHLLPKCHPVDSVIDVDLYLPGCPPTPKLFMAILRKSTNMKIAKTVCQECGLKKVKEMRPSHLLGARQGEVLPDICLINQGHLCVGSSTRGGCQAICTKAGYPCVGCRGPSDAFIEKDSQTWLISIRRIFSHMTDVPDAKIDAALRSQKLSLFLFQFADYLGMEQATRHKEKMV